MTGVPFTSSVQNAVRRLLRRPANLPSPIGPQEVEEALRDITEFTVRDSAKSADSVAKALKKVAEDKHRDDPHSLT